MVDYETLVIKIQINYFKYIEMYFESSENIGSMFEWSYGIKLRIVAILSNNYSNSYIVDYKTYMSTYFGYYNMKYSKLTKIKTVI